MSQRDVEALLGRLVIDAHLRQCFFENPEEIVAQQSYNLSPRELSALLRIDEIELEVMAAKLGAVVRAAASVQRKVPVVFEAPAQRPRNRS